MTTKYKILFMVEMKNDYYSNLQCTDFDIIPTDETKHLLKNRQMMCKAIGNKLVVLVKVKTFGPDTDKPFINMNPDDKFLFYLQLNKPQFNTYTNLDVEKLREGKRYYFTNLYENKLDDDLSLTKQIVPVVGPASYMPGDFTADGVGTVYECIRSTTEINNPPPANTFWQDRGKQQYVSSRDMLAVKTRVENFTVTTAAKNFSIKVFGLNIANNKYDKEIKIKENLVTSSEDTKQLQVKLTELLPGRYKVIINTDEFDLFIDDSAVYNNVFGVLEIFSHLGNGTDFAFFDIAGKVKDKVTGITPEWLRYKIRFANRLAYWKYNTPRHGVTAIDGGILYSFDPSPAGPGDKNYFTSSKPIPLLETPWKFKLNVQSLTNDEDPFAPNPDPNLSGMLSRSETDKDYYCTINLNY
jgi:hypothetical protein